MRRSSLALLALLLAACGTPAAPASEGAASPPLCDVTGARSFAAFADLPPPVASDLLSRFADVPTTESAANPERALAPRDAFFNGTGTRSSLLPNRRFAQGIARGDDVVVIYEHGGGPHIHVALYRRSDTGGYHAMANALSADRVHCETAERLMANPRDPALWFSRIDW